MSGSTVLTCRKGGNAFFVSADSFSTVDFMGAEVMPDGDQYYIDKAVSLGATVKESVKPKAKKKAKK